jgi:hypothetical protein
MKLTEIQIQNLYKFTREHFVYHYDVQTELVDHLANDIEEIWLAEPHFSFEEAREKSFKKFGIFGFMDVVESKQKQMNKRYWKIIWRFVREWFTLPKAMITASIFVALYFFLTIQYSEYFLMGSFLLFIIYDMIQLKKEGKLFKKKEIKEKKGEKIFLLESMIGTSRAGFTAITFANLFNVINLTKMEFSTLESHWLVLVALSATLVVILFYVVSYVIPEKAEELLQETYPEYKIVKNL